MPLKYQLDQSRKKKKEEERRRERAREMGPPSGGNASSIGRRAARPPTGREGVGAGRDDAATAASAINGAGRRQQTMRLGLELDTAGPSR